jgi:inner membrane transporter RhtA
VSPSRRASPAGPLLLVLGGVVSVQFGGALAATLIPEIGPTGSVLLRLGIATVILVAIVRPRLAARSRRAWTTVVLFGLALGLMNWTFYGSLAHLPIGVAVTIEFIGPLALATALSRRGRDFAAVAAAAVGVVLISEALQVPLAELDWAGIGLALAAGACWAGYVVLSGRTGAEFERLDGLAIALVVATLVVLPVGVTSVHGWDGGVLVRGLGIAVLSSLIPYSFELLALRRLSARVFGVLLSLEPVAAAVAGLLVLDQRLNAAQLAGMALVVTASAIVLGFGREHESPPDEIAEAAADTGA